MNAVESKRVASLIDVDNTLLDNDRVKADMHAELANLLGSEKTAEFWWIYEEVRSAESVVDIPKTLSRFSAANADEAGRLKRRLAAIFMEFPFDQYLYPGALETIEYLQQFGPAVILSDGDPIYQAAKIARSGLGAAVNGYVLVFRHKEDHLEAVTAAFPADHYLSLDDKPRVLQRIAGRMEEPLSTIFVRQGHYAERIPPGQWRGAGLTVESIADIPGYSIEELIAAGTGEQLTGFD